DGEDAGRLEGLQAIGAAIQAEEDEGRVEGNRVEGVRGEAEIFAVQPHRGDDGDSGRETSHGMAKGAGIEGHRGQATGGMKLRQNPENPALEPADCSGRLGPADRRGRWLLTDRTGAVPSGGVAGVARLSWC